VSIPKDATVIDLSGKTVLPGLVDMHGHMYARAGPDLHSQFDAYPLLFLAGGVTTVRSPGDFEPAEMIALRERIRAHQAVGPRIFTAGPYFDHAPSQVLWIKGINSAEEAVALFELWKARIDYVKLYTRITEDEMRAVLAAAHRAHLRVTGHLNSISAGRAIELGIDGLEHGIFGMSELVPAERKKEAACALADLDVDSPMVTDLINRIVDHHVVIDPTIVTFQKIPPDSQASDPDWLEYLNDETRAFRTRPQAPPTDAERATAACWYRAIERQTQFVRRLHERGGIIVTGTDPVSPRMTPGRALHEEIANLVAAGLSPVAAIRAATLNGATALGRSQDFGTVTPGKLADLVVVAGNPAASIADISRTEIVFQEGRRYDPSELRKSARGRIH
jgi:imidazolonepropionase-like amidohydrolase